MDRNPVMSTISYTTAMSLSARRAWIEIGPAFLFRTLALGSLSARRAWIEIYRGCPL